MGILFLYIQVLAAPGLSIFGIVPNIMLAFVIFLSMTIGIIPTLIMLFILGVMQDITNPNLLGINTLCYLVLAWIVASFHESLDKEKFLSHLIIIGVVNLIYAFIFFIVQLVMAGYSVKLIPLVFFSIIYNIVLSIIFTFILSMLYRMKISFHEE